MRMGTELHGRVWVREEKANPKTGEREEGEANKVGVALGKTVGSLERFSAAFIGPLQGPRRGVSCTDREP